MDLQKFYQNIESDYSSVLERFMHKEALVHKFLKKFLEDKTFQSLTDALAEEDYETALRAVHTLKGVSANLGLEKLYQYSSEMTQAFRAKDIPQAKTLFEPLKKEYETTIAFIGEIN